MAIPYKIHVLKSSDLSVTHFSLSVPEEFYLAKAIIFDAYTVEQPKILDCVRRVLTGKDTKYGFRTDAFSSKIIEKDGVKILVIRSEGFEDNRVQQVSLKDFEDMLATWIRVREEFAKNPSGYREVLRRIIEIDERRMVALISNSDKPDALVRVSNRDDNLWQIEIGPFREDGQPHSYQSTLLTEEEILMNRKDILQLSREIKKVLGSKTTENERLMLTFRQNEPQLRIDMHWVDEENHLREGLKGMVKFTPAINVEYLMRAYGREEDKVYRKGHTGLTQYYYLEELEKFADDLEREAES